MSEPTPSAQAANDARTQTAKPASEPLRGDKQATALELAMLAAMINPAACRNGNSRDAVFQAMILFHESIDICEKMAAGDPLKFLDSIRWECRAAGELWHMLIEKFLKTPDVFLTLAIRDKDDDELRPYLAERLKLEGRTGRKGWCNVRTVTDNLRAMLVDLANRRNRLNADGIRARELADEKEAKERGITVEQVRIGRTTLRNELWEDGETEFNNLMGRAAVWENGAVARHRFRKGFVDEFIKWKRDIRRRGGSKAIGPLTRAEVFWKACQKKIPKIVR